MESNDIAMLKFLASKAPKLPSPFVDDFLQGVLDPREDNGLETLRYLITEYGLDVNSPFRKSMAIEEPAVCKHTLVGRGSQTL